MFRTSYSETRSTTEHTLHRSGLAVRTAGRRRRMRARRVRRLRLTGAEEAVARAHAAARRGATGAGVSRVAGAFHCSCSLEMS